MSRALSQSSTADKYLLSTCCARTVPDRGATSQPDPEGAYSLVWSPAGHQMP